VSYSRFETSEPSLTVGLLTELDSDSKSNGRAR